MVKALALAFMIWAGAASAQCRLALVLALDVSSSVDHAEYALQRDGIAAALHDPDIRQAIFSDKAFHVSVAVYEWSGRYQNRLVVDWTNLRSDADIDHVILTIMNSPRSQTQYPTAMGYALGYGANLLERAPFCERQVIDVSGDGISNDGFGPRIAYRHFPFRDVTVNGLAVLGADAAVEDYFIDVVRHGPGAFVETSEGYAGFRQAMTRKLFRELNGLVIGGTNPGTEPG